MAVDYSKIQELLGDEAETLLGYSEPKISKDNLYLPGGILLTVCGWTRTEIRRFCAHCRRFLITEGFRERVIFRFCP
jgi:hypothetical protein